MLREMLNTRLAPMFQILKGENVIRVGCCRCVTITSDEGKSKVHVGVGRRGVISDPYISEDRLILSYHVLQERS